MTLQEGAQPNEAAAITEEQEKDLGAGFDEGADAQLNEDGSVTPAEKGKEDETPPVAEKKGKEKEVAVEGETKPVKTEKPVEGAAKEGETAVAEEPKTAAEKAEAAVKKIEEAEKASQGEQGGNVIDALPPAYEWAKEAVNSGKLEKWLEAQPKAIQKAAKSPDVDDATYVLDLYKKAQEPEQPSTAGALQAMLDKYGDKQFKGPDGKPKTIKQMVADYENGELMEAAAVMADAIAEARMTDKVSAKDLDKLEKRLQEMTEEAQIQQQRAHFWEIVTEAHADGRKLARSNKVGEWVKGQSAGMQRLYNSPDPDHAILVLDAYKEAMAKNALQEETGKAADKKKKLDGLYGESLKGKREVKTGASHSEVDDDDAFDKGFEEGTKK